MTSTMFNDNQNDDMLMTNSSQLGNVRLPKSLCDNGGELNNFGFDQLSDPGLPTTSPCNLNLYPGGFFSTFDPFILSPSDPNRETLEDQNFKNLFVGNAKSGDFIPSDEDEINGSGVNYQQKTTFFARKSKPKPLEDAFSLSSSSDEDEIHVSTHLDQLPQADIHRSGSVKAKLLEFLNRRSFKSPSEAASNEILDKETTNISFQNSTIMSSESSSTTPNMESLLESGLAQNNLVSLENVYPPDQICNEKLFDQMIHEILGVPSESSSLLRNRSTGDLFRTLYLQVTDSKSKRKSYNFKPDKVYQPVEETEVEDEEATGTNEFFNTKSKISRFKKINKEEHL